ncbi:MAG: hypothetical protein ACPL7L_01140, partial [bacterium]
MGDEIFFDTGIPLAAPAENASLASRRDAKIAKKTLYSFRPLGGGGFAARNNAFFLALPASLREKMLFRPLAE